MESEREKRVLSLLALETNLEFASTEGVAMTKMQVAVHVWVRECRHIFGGVLFLKAELFITGSSVAVEKFLV
jgi:hypothetical protein